MRNNPRKSILFFFFPVLAILACNAPIEEFFPAETPTLAKPTIGPPPTLTPLALEESDFVIVTQTPKPTLTPTPVVDTPTPEPTPTPSITPTLIPTVTRNPNFADQEDQTATPFPVTVEPIALEVSVQWEEGTELEKQDNYNGLLTFTASGGSDAYLYFVEGLQLASDNLRIVVVECETKSYDVVVRSADTDPLEQTISVEAPCFEFSEPISP